MKDLPVQCFSERDFLFPDADEKYVPEVRPCHRLQRRNLNLNKRVIRESSV